MDHARDFDTPAPSEAFDRDALLRLARAVHATGYRFTTITPATHARVNARPENAAARDLPGVFGWSRPFGPDILPPGLFDLMREAGVVQQHADGHRSLVRISTLGDQPFLHSAFPTTAADAVFFGPDTYKFVDAVDAWLDAATRPIRRAVDICSGTGAAALRIAARVPGAEVLAVDINDTALRFAAVNAALGDLSNLRFCHSNLLSDVEGAFDLVVAHPPYLIDGRGRAYRHGGGALGADLAIAIVRSASERLAPGGTLLLFTGIAIEGGHDPFRAIVEPPLREAGFRTGYREVDPDVFGEELAHPPYDHTDRIALVVLTATRPA